MALFDRLNPRKRRKGDLQRTDAPASQAGGIPLAAPAATAHVAVTARADTHLPRFHTTAGDQLDRRYNGPNLRERMRLRDAFTPAQPVTNPSMFAGREDVLRRLIGAIEDQRVHVVIHGQRGVGKTSLLHMLGMAAREARYIVVYLSCGSASEFDETFRTAATEIPLLFHRGISPTSTSNEQGSSLADLLPGGVLTPRQFGDVAAKLVGTRVLIVLDEFDRAQSPEFRRNIAELVKTLSDLSARVQLVIGGVANDLVELMGHVPSIRRSIFAMEIAPLVDQEVRALIANGERASGLRFEESARRIVIAASSGSPYVVNLICHLGGMNTLDAERLMVTPEDVIDAVAEAMGIFRRRLPAEIVDYVDTLLLDSRTRAAEGLDARTGDTLQTDRLLRRIEAAGLLTDKDSDYHAFVAEALAPYVQLLSVQLAYTNQPATKSA